MAKKILLADDSLTIQKVVELTFSDSDYDLVCVSNGQRALERVEEDRPDLILADVVMPEKNGYEVCEAIKGNPATARIPVVLLSGTFEPFDRDRAERIGADAIVSKPFDSQQLLRQVEALVEAPPHEASMATTMAIPIIPVAPPPPEKELDPFDAGFSPDEFTGEIPTPPGEQPESDLFEQEYVGADVESAIAAFEKVHPPETEEAATGREGREELRSSRESLAQWISDEPEGTRSESEPPAEAFSPGSPFWKPKTSERVDALDFVMDESGGRRRAEPAARADEAPTMEIRRDLYAFGGAVPTEEPAAGEGETTEGGEVPVGAMPAPSGPEAEEATEGGEVPVGAMPPPSGPEAEGAPEEISAREAEVLFDLPASAPETPAEAAAPEPAADKPEILPEIEELAQTSSIPELTQMLSSVSRSGELTDAEIDRIAARIVEKLSDRVVREIAWEVIPDMAELVIKQRIKELEAGAE